MSNDTLASALAAYSAFLQFSVENPKLGSWSMAKSSLKLPDVDKVWDAETVSSEQYLWHVAYTLHVLDRVTMLTTDYDGSVVKHLRHHREILAECWSGHWQPECSKRINKLVKQVLAEKPNA